jgi:ferredoxin
MRLSADVETCDGYGTCVLQAAGYLELGDDGLVRVLMEDVADADADRVEMAVAACPVNALSIAVP